jgi:(2Fe-2S) ferredoxin
MSTFDHLFVFLCINQKENGKKCCAMFDAENMFDYMRTQFKEKRHLMSQTTHIKVVETSCLGKCSFGPNIFISPDNIWYKYDSKQDIDEIIDSHLINGKIVTRLINRLVPTECTPTASS